jgi:two-component system sensor histidine kinase ChiS
MSPLILLVDDDLTNLLLLEELLGSEGYQTDSATSGMEALEKSGTRVPDLILLDVMMPDMDGFEACRRLRENPQLQTVPIILLTALDDEASQIQGLESLADAYFTKPIRSNLLLAKISSLLQLQTIREKQRADKVKPQFDLAWSVNEELIEKFRLFVPEQFLCRIAPQGVDSIRLGNALEEEITVLFCDIRGFTALAESQEALATYKWLNAFFSQMSEAIAANYGFIDKYLGDAIMAVFDRPGSHPNDGINAALYMAYALQEFNHNRQQFNLENPVKIGIGINTGKAVIGTIGSNSRMDSTVIGDAVNTASRLEELTKYYRCDIIVSETVINQIFPDNLAENVYARSLDRLVLRGKTNPIKIYELLGNSRLILDPMKLKTKALFEAAIQFWFAEDFPQSLITFEQVLQENPQDAIAEFYVQRCREQIEQINL